MEIVRVLRVLEYTGTREWVELAIKIRAVKGEMAIRSNPRFRGVIREAVLGETIEVIDTFRESGLADMPKKEEKE